jgi:pyridinium-3,5-bisthiocarboxylic acid mononucleotide nickel chelatase
VRGLIFDPFSGISGDMTIAALLDLGLPLEWLQDFVAGLGLGPIEVASERVMRNGIACTRLLLELPHEHAHRHLKDIVRIIEGTSVTSEVREKSIEAFTLLAQAEAEVHGTTIDRVHFHEVGALDAIVDVLGAIAGCRELGFGDCYTRPVALGRGWAKMAHGNFPVPPPAALNLLRGIAVRDPSYEGECTTPTGATLLAVLTEGRSPPVEFVPTAVGYGAGTRDPKDRPNCLRLIAVQTGDARRELLVLQTDVDDLAPEYVPPLIDGALAAGALDCTAVPILMKKGRPGLRIEALIEPGRYSAVAAAIFRGSTSIGLRSWPVAREALPRSEAVVQWKGQAIRVKRSTLPDGKQRAKPEFEDVVRAAQALGMTPLEVYRGLLADGVVAEG